MVGGGGGVHTPWAPNCIFKMLLQGRTLSYNILNVSILTVITSYIMGM
jgi:hypothetical protein